MKVLGAATLTMGLIAATYPQGASEVELQWKFRKGESLRYDVTVSVEPTGAAPLKGKGEWGFRWLWLVQECREDGGATIKWTIERVKASRFDSEKNPKAEETDLVGRYYSAHVGKSLTLRLSKTGKCESVEGMKELQEAARNALPEDLRDLETPQPDSLQARPWAALLNTYFAFLPSSKVAKAAEWETLHTAPLDNSGDLELKSKCIFEELADKRATLTQKAGVVFMPSNRVKGVEVKNGVLECKTIWLVDKGCLESTKVDLKIEMEINKQVMGLIWTSTVTLVK